MTWCRFCSESTFSWHKSNNCLTWERVRRWAGRSHHPWELRTICGASQRPRRRYRTPRPSCAGTCRCLLRLCLMPGSDSQMRWSRALSPALWAVQGLSRRGCGVQGWVASAQCCRCPFFGCRRVCKLFQREMFCKFHIRWVLLIPTYLNVINYGLTFCHLSISLWCILPVIALRLPPPCKA